jgi:energy-coupling factor transporter ATP-binding protein EcfA2
MNDEHGERQGAGDDALPKRQRKSKAVRPAKRTKPKGSTPIDENIARRHENIEASSPKASLSHEIDGLVYVLDRQPKKNGRRSVVSVKLAGSETSKKLVDRVDLFSFRSRQAFAGVVSDTFGRQVGDVQGHLVLVLDDIERAEVKATVSELPVLTPARKKAAEKLLGSKNILDKAANALNDLGYVGETKSKKLGYLVATSRLLSRPLSAILMAPSGAGKSHLLDTLALLLPEESIEYLSRLTPSALFYLGADALRHRLVLVDETVGASEADYPIRTLQSKGFLRLAATVKGRSEAFVVHGPIALMSSTTDANLNPENLSRCLELTLDDGKEQTRLIQEAQRKAWAGERNDVNVEVWKDGQRLLEPLHVVIPFAKKLDYPTRTTKDRRDNQKLLTLVAAHALLHQRQRERDKDGRLIATTDDYRIVYDLVRTSVEEDVEDLSPRAAALYRHLASLERAPFTRREVAEKLGWSYMTTKRALDELVGNELVALTDREYVRSYLILDSTIFGNGSSLKHPDEID